jgi:hypothetical protein
MPERGVDLSCGSVGFEKAALDKTGEILYIIPMNLL